MSFAGGPDAARAEFGSPEARAGAIKAPVLLIQAAKDYTVPYAQFEDLGAALKGGGVKVETAEYGQADHAIWPERYRIDLLARIGEFLEANLR
jgi:dipeptidyl aminopeptidase/acylaminoacyl peptidase